ncbi:MAG: cytochrome c biogenesis protein CcsA [Planctomycetaceae bacterium]|nr:cytochrome c biogenesis protein CcsA [Planctomycetaceae bacterium]
MSTTSLPGNLPSKDDVTSVRDQMDSVAWRCIEALASLKLTCVLFILGMLIVFVGSLAQARKDVWLVVAQYFRTYVAWIDIPDLFPPSMFPGFVDTNWDDLGIFRRIPFPGGWTIGWLMLANLFAAHFLRFKIRATGSRLVAGISIIILGAVVTFAVVWTGNQQTGVDAGNTLLSPTQIWYLMLSVLGAAAAIPIGMTIFKTGLSRSERTLYLVTGVTLAGVLAYFLIGGEAARLNLSSMRILWQLLKGTACAIIILIGCNLLFEKRGGVVLLHIGVALLMFSELQVGFHAEENLLGLTEGQTSGFLRDMRERELAVIHRQEDGKEKVVAIPDHILIRAAEADADSPARIIDIESLPFRIRVDRFMQNSRLRALLPNDEKAASTGLGTFAFPVEIDPVTGMDDSHDMSSLQMTLLAKDSDQVLDQLLLHQEISEMRKVPIAEQLQVKDEPWQFYLRFQRNYRDWQVKLLDVSRTDYIGTSTPRDYRSRILIRDRNTGEEEEFTLWMNNPLRYKGETFYQTGYNQAPDGTEMTTLSVVRNTGWMLPYIACMIVAVGMFAQFGQTLSRYLGRLDRQPPPKSAGSGSTNPTAVKPVIGPDGTFAQESAAPPVATSPWPVLVPVLMVALFGAWLMKEARPPKQDPQAMNLFGFAQLPVAWKGRAQPIDSFARTELLMASHKSTFKGELTAAELGQPKKREQLLKLIRKAWPSVDTSQLSEFSGDYNEWIDEVVHLSSSGREAVEERLREAMTMRMPAVRWLLDVITQPKVAARHRVIKIDNDQVLALLGLEKRAGLTYSMEEVQKNLKEVEAVHREGLKLQMADQEHHMSQLQRRVVSLVSTVRRIDSLQNVFLSSDDEGLLPALVRAWWVTERLQGMQSVMAVPTGLDNDQRSWETLIAAGALRNVIGEMQQRGLKTPDDIRSYVQTKLVEESADRETLTRSVEGSLQILQQIVKNEAEKAGTDVADDAVQKRAAAGAAAMTDPMLRRVLSIIAKSAAGDSVEDMVAKVSDDELKAMATERISADVFTVFEEISAKERDTRLNDIRRRLQAMPAQDEAALTSRMNLELVNITLDDLQKRAGDLLFSEQNPEVFVAATDSMFGILEAWQQGDVEAFNNTLADYQNRLREKPLPHVRADVVKAETFFNFYEPFMKAIYLYLPVLIVSFLSWIVWPKTLRRTGFWVMLLAFAVHSYALIMRMYISGRPPVTNLYSSAIFIGWAAVAAAFPVERLLKNGIGNILGSSVGAATLVIAHYLARDEGDTLGVMQAVLDTTFWLATHVVCITLGYAATFLAGAMAIAYWAMSTFGRQDKQDELSRLGRMIYGVLCFAVFFSLVGTVLGGLWADDSWGRFWGWDPKENGAMLIVMWNALILHARWDKMVRDYGTAVLAMFGNIVTAWSWFGVNELKAGLHTYGFTEGRLLALVVFIGLQSLLIAIALLPKRTPTPAT